MSLLLPDGGGGGRSSGGGGGAARSGGGGGGDESRSGGDTMVCRVVSPTPFVKWPFILLVKAGKLADKVALFRTDFVLIPCAHE